MLRGYRIMRKLSLKQLIERKISRCWKRNVFVRNDFAKMGGYDQVGRVLLEQTKEGKLINIGYGLYAKARINRLTGDIMLASKGGFIQVAREALDVLGVKWEISEAEQRYNKKLTTQIPIELGVIIKIRCNRTIRIAKNKLQVSRG